MNRCFDRLKKNFFVTESSRFLALIALISGIVSVGFPALPQSEEPDGPTLAPVESETPAISRAPKPEKKKSMKMNVPVPPTPTPAPSAPRERGSGLLKGSPRNPLPPTSLETSRKFPKVVTKLMIDDLQVGRGKASKPGSKMVVHFQSWLYDPTQPLGRGPQFETTHGKPPYKFTLQNPEAPHIKGWDDGLVDMKPGGKRRLIIPPDLAYGASGAGQVIPPGATLLYEIELVEIE